MDGERLPGTFSYAEAQAKVSELQLGGQEAFAWIGLHAPTEHQMQEVGDAFSMHPLAIEDAVCAHQRPKLERYDESLFLVLKTLNYVPHESTLLAREIVETGEIMVFVNCDFVVTVRHGDHGRLSDVRKRMDSDPEHMRLGPFAVMHAIADAVVDHYLEVTQLMEGDIDAIEEEAFARDHVARLGFPSLRTVASPVPPDRIKSKEFQQLIDDMIETMYEYSGVGLAAPQVHLPIQLAVLEVNDHPRIPT